MLARLLVPLALMLVAGFAHPQEQESRQAKLVLDEGVWVTFYDLPSRRFRAIRTAILASDSESAKRDLAVSASYISVEADRASDNLREPLREVVSRLKAHSENIEGAGLQDLDRLFGRVHWLLAQHYLERARRARDIRDNRSTSLLLYAVTHHLERALLRNNVPVSREVHATLEDLRDVAGRLQGANTFEQAYREKPVVRAERLLRQIGMQIERPVLIATQP
ncbi:MAG: hypothetical protein R3192_10715 [Woeseiaceae bacterium]|nr:hypothetical protein [Woeseiaceae bacterium]